MNQEMQNVANAIMYSAIMHDKKQEELENKARKYDELKEAVGKIKEEIKECKEIHLQKGTSESESMASAYNTCIDIIKTHTEGLI